ncbi:hypothetical protein CCYA_CCYA15G3915 [Cyanidiococcus yangmingshanensis]|nr:hypothetical protein CCYA_CCYA15G3915 [Cyanidiococcus yangmingshanensis]
MSGEVSSLFRGPYDCVRSGGVRCTAALAPTTGAVYASRPRCISGATVHPLLRVVKGNVLNKTKSTRKASQSHRRKIGKRARSGASSGRRRKSLHLE